MLSNGDDGEVEKPEKISCERPVTLHNGQSFSTTTSLHGQVLPA